jgi:hypothetical protein
MELRADIVWPVTVAAEVGVLQGRTINISASGALLRCPDQPSLREIVRLTIKPPVRTPLEITAEVVRINVQCAEADDTPEGIAVRFIIISENDRQFISFSVYDNLQGERVLDHSLYSPANPSQKARTFVPKSGR